MYKGLALKAGVLLSIMFFFNGMLTSKVGPYYSNLIFHLIGLVLILIISFIVKNKRPSIRKIPILYFLPGILSMIVVVSNNICIGKLGITLTIVISLFGQLVISNIIDHFGLFGMPVNPFKKEKLIGFSIVIIGIISMVSF